MPDFKDWEHQYVYLMKRYFEVSLDFLISTQGHIPSSKKIVDKLVFDPSENDEKDGRIEKIEMIYNLINSKGFLTDRQRQVASLYLGWNDNVFVGSKRVSDIARILGIAQPVAFNHLKFVIKKIKKHIKKLEDGKNP